MDQSNQHEFGAEASGICPDCGKTLPSDAPRGLCPSCLLDFDLDAGISSDGTNSRISSNKSSSGQQEFVPQPFNELAQFFPNLELQDVLGFGGMGAVYRARQTNLDRTVALKIVRPEVIGRAGFAERFSREARALAKLNHQNIVGIYDFGEIDNKFYLVMEFVDGVTLRQLIADNQLTSEQALPIIQQICEALQFAHDEGVVHRDIKPENILIDTKGRVKIADFGLAKLLSETEHELTLTGTHQVMGTPRYMAPEQMEGARQVDHRADIYSLGVVFYEMLTGELPLGQFEPPSRKAKLDGRLDDVVMRSLAKEPERRYQQASEIKTDVDSICQSGMSPTQSVAGASGVELLQGSGGRLTAHRQAYKPNDLDRTPINASAFRWDTMNIVYCVMMALCFLGFLSLFWWWGQVSLVATDALTSVTIGVKAFNYVYPILAAIFCLVAGLICVATLRKQSMFAGAASCAAGIALAAAAILVVIGPPLTEHDSEYRDFGNAVNAPMGPSAIDAINHMRIRNEISVNAGPTVMSFAALFAGLGIIVLSIVVIKSKLDEITNSAAHSVDVSLKKAATALMFAAVVQIALLPLLFVFYSSASSDMFTRHLDGDSIENFFLMTTCMQLAATLLFVPLLIIAAQRIKAGLSRWLGLVCAVLIMLPLSPGFIFGLPLGAIVLRILFAPHVIEEMDRKVVSPELGRRQLRRAGLALWTSGILQIVIGTFFVLSVAALLGWFSIQKMPANIQGIESFASLLAFQNAPSDAASEVSGSSSGGTYSNIAVILAAIYCLMVCLQAIPMMICGNALKNLKWCRWHYALLAALIPLTPFWIVTMPIGIYLLAVFGQKVDSKTGQMESLLKNVKPTLPDAPNFDQLPKFQTEYSEPELKLKPKPPLTPLATPTPKTNIQRWTWIILGLIVAGGTSLFAFSGQGLAWSIEQRDTKFAEFFITFGADSTEGYGNSKPPLLAAASQQDNKMIEFLLQHGADPNYQKPGHSPPLFWAAAEGDLKSLLLLLKYRAEVDNRDEFGATPLMIASATGRVEIVKELINAGANLELRDRDLAKTGLRIYRGQSIDYDWKGRGQTALTLAARNGHWLVVKQLLVAGANKDVVDGDGKTALQLATEAKKETTVSILENHNKEAAKTD